jgi:hypothetical protein
MRTRGVRRIAGLLLLALLARGDSRQGPPSRLDPPPLSDPFDVLIAPGASGPNEPVYPALGDIDGDGRADLLMGDRKGRMRFSRNIGTATRPEFAAPIGFDALCPDGRIPTG